VRLRAVACGCVRLRIELFIMCAGNSRAVVALVALLHLQDRMDELTVSMASEEADADREAMEAEMDDLQVCRWRGWAMH